MTNAMSANGKPAAGRRASKHESRLRFEMLNAFVDSSMADLSRAEIATWLVLFRDAKQDGTAQTSLDDIARRGGMDRQTPHRAVIQLKRRKMLRVARQGGYRRGASRYSIFPFAME